MWVSVPRVLVVSANYRFVIFDVGMFAIVV